MILTDRGSITCKSYEMKRGQMPHRSVPPEHLAEGSVIMSPIHPKSSPAILSALEIFTGAFLWKWIVHANFTVLRRNVDRGRAGPRVLWLETSNKDNGDFVWQSSSVCIREAKNKHKAWKNFLNRVPKSWKRIAWTNHFSEYLHPMRRIKDVVSRNQSCCLSHSSQRANNFMS